MTNAKLLVCLVLVSIASTGCKVFLPAHGNSNGRAGERVTLKMLDYDAMTSYWGEYTNAFNCKIPKKPQPDSTTGPADFGATAAAAVLGFAVDYVKKELEQEATLYEAQFGTTVADDKFWLFSNSDDNPNEMTDIRSKKSTTREEKKTVDGGKESVVKTVISEDTSESVIKNLGKYRQNFYGIEVKRHLETNEVFKMVIGIAPSADEQFFRLAPLTFWTGKTKAKVLGDKFLTYLGPWNWPGKLLRTDGHHVNTTVALEVNGYWKDKTQEAKVSKVASVEFNINGYDITATKEWTASGKNGPKTKLSQSSAGWLLGVPISLTPSGTLIPSPSGYAGTFTVKATVTEKDPSNAKENLEKAAQLVGEQKSKVVELVK